MDIGPGDTVEVVKPWCAMRIGMVCIISGLQTPISNCYSCGEWPKFAILLANDPNGEPPPGYGYCHCFFRPYRGPEIERERWNQSITDENAPDYFAKRHYTART